MRRRGFTLLEALAAVVILGLVAAAAVPLLRRLGDAGIPERALAQACLAKLPLGGDPAGWDARPLPGHPDWSLAVSALQADPEPAPPAGAAPPAGPTHRWLRLAVRDARGAILAESAVLDLPRGPR